MRFSVEKSPTHTQSAPRHGFGITCEMACSEQLWKFAQLRRRVLDVRRAVITTVLLLVQLSVAQAQTLSATNEIVQLPQAGPVHLWSPDHQWMLVADALPLDYVGEQYIWLEAADGRNRRLVKRYDRNLSLG